MPTETPTQQLADVLLGGGLEEFVRSRRPGRSWRLIARDLWEATNHRVDVTYETVRGWYPDPPGTEDGGDEANAPPLARAG